MSSILPAITLYQPWATWIIRGWKTIETRTHNKFSSLKGQRIFIHAGKITDGNAALNEFLSPEQIMLDPAEVINGFIIGVAYVSDFTELTAEHSKAALIDCGLVRRWGLFLTEVTKLDEPLPIFGEMGIWYFDIDKKVKVKKSEIQLKPEGYVYL